MLTGVYTTLVLFMLSFFFSSRRRHTRYWRDWSSDVCSSDLDRTALRSLAAEYAQLCERTSTDLAATCASAAFVRTAFSDRAAFVFTSRDDVVRQLSRFAESGQAALVARRSEERRVGKECRSR